MSPLQRHRQASPAARRRPHRRGGSGRNGFTLAELLVVIGIIALLVSILVPTVAAIKTAAQATDTRAFIRSLDAAAESYKLDFQDYPGVFPENMLGIGNGAMDIDVEQVEGTALDTLGFYDGGGELENVTSSENFYLALQGGLLRGESGIIYDPTRVGQGPASLGLVNLTSKTAYITADNDTNSMRTSGELDAQLSIETTGDLMHGRFLDQAAPAEDSIVPEFVDRFGDPMPILYLRPTNTARNAAAAGDGVSGPQTYQLGTITGYTNEISYSFGGTGLDGFIGQGRDDVSDVHAANNLFHGLQVAGDGDDLNGLATLENDGPFDGNAYLTDPSTGVGARQANRFILISAGVDRVYGTADDITNFGPVRP